MMRLKQLDDTMPARGRRRTDERVYPRGDMLLLDKGDAARTLRVSVRQLSRFVASGELTPVRLGPRLVRFTLADLEAFVVRHGQKATRSWPEPVRRLGRR